jgi:site-specific recombinase XerC
MREFVSLDVDHVDWNARAARRADGGGQLDIPGSPDAVSQALETHLADREACQAASEGGIFVSNRGERLSVRSIQES